MLDIQGKADRNIIGAIFGLVGFYFFLMFAAFGTAIWAVIKLVSWITS